MAWLLLLLLFSLASSSDSLEEISHSAAVNAKGRYTANFATASIVAIRTRNTTVVSYSGFSVEACPRYVEPTAIKIIPEQMKVFAHIAARIWRVDAREPRTGFEEMR